jgi:hypothetical protein
VTRPEPGRSTGTCRARRGFSLVEVLMALGFLSTVLLSLIMLNTFSSRSSLDAYYELIAFQLAREPIEVFREFGHRWLERNYLETLHPLPEFPPTRVNLEEIDPLALRYPAESRAFYREIEVHRCASGPGIQVTVRIGPRASGRLQYWLRAAKAIELRAMILPLPKP